MQNTVLEGAVSTLKPGKRTLESADVVAAVDLKLANKRGDLRLARRVDVVVEQVPSGGGIEPAEERVLYGRAWT